MTTITVEVPADACATLHRSPRELGREMRLAAAMLPYAQAEFFHGKAAPSAPASAGSTWTS